MISSQISALLGLLRQRNILQVHPLLTMENMIQREISQALPRIIFLICQQREVGFHCNGVWKSKGRSSIEQCQHREVLVGEGLGLLEVGLESTAMLDCALKNTFFLTCSQEHNTILVEFINLLLVELCLNACIVYIYN